MFPAWAVSYVDGVVRAVANGQVLTNEVLEAESSSGNHAIRWRASISLSLAVAAGWLVVRLALLSVLGVPDPRIHDEFSYLLGADTFAHGRLTNPPHPLAPFFASPHILLEPTYSSKYPPGQALFLAAGQVLFGHPFYGVVLEGALMMFLLCLMLCLWTSLWPAAIVSIALAIFFQPPMYWVDSYWGGCLAVCGATMLLIAIGWFRISPNAVSGCIFAAGGVLLFVTRPFEGGIAFLVSLLIWAWDTAVRRKPGQMRKLLTAAACGIPVIAIAAVGTAAHDFAVTGSAFTIPYVLHTRKFDVAPAFWFLPLRQPDPVYPQPRLAAFLGSSGWAVAKYREARRIRHGYAGHLLVAAILILGPRPLPHGFFPPLPFLLFGLCLVAGRVLADRRIWICLALLAAGIFASSPEAWQQQHYMAPTVPAIVLLWGILVEGTLPIKVGKVRVGPIAVGLIFLVALAPSVSATVLDCRGQPTRMQWPVELRKWPHERTEMIRRLSFTSKPNLVIVRYPSPDWDTLEELVYNGADIDRQPVVFAHDLGAAKNRELLEYYRDRTAWLLTFDPNDPDKLFLNPYPR